MNRLALGIVFAATTARADDIEWRTYAAFRNDAFTDLTPPLDDFGFTHDNVLSVVRANGNLAFGGRAVHRWLTSTVDYRRWDQLDVLALVERALPEQHLVVSGRVGPTLGGNFGGRYLQNGWHVISGTGPTLDDNALANDYPGDRSFGIVAGGRARGQLGAERGHGYAIVDGQLTMFGGVSSIETAIGAAASTRHVGVHVELAVTRYHAVDGNLALPGGYGSGWQLEWRVGAHVAWSRFRVSYEYRANEGGSGEPIGVIAFQSKR